MPRKTVSKRRTRVKARARAKRVSRRRKGGECGDITKHKDNYHCVEAGCEPRKCAKYYKASMPHQLTDEIDLIALRNAAIARKKQNARDERRASRVALRAALRAASQTASYSPRTSNLIPTSSSHYWGISDSDSDSDDE